MRVMSPLILIPFVAFMGCVLGQFYLTRQVRQVLATRHPEVWRDLSTKAFFIDNALFSFVWRGRDKALNDPELNQATQRVRTLQIVAFAVWLVYAAMLFTSGSFHKP
jgi:hypothetical protein